MQGSEYQMQLIREYTGLLNDVRAMRDRIQRQSGRGAQGNSRKNKTVKKGS